MDAILPDVTCDLELGYGEVRVRRAVIHDGTGQVIVEGNISLNKGNPMDLTLTVDELDVKTALGIVRPGKSDPIDGRISGKVVAKGDLSHPALELQLNTRHLSVGDSP